MSDRELAAARSLVAGRERAVVLTGAGISADSGVPTFRGPEGLWRRWRPEELATPAAFARDPRLVWEWYGWRRDAVAACRPNAAHVALARWSLGRPGIRILTQNVDGLHDRAARELSGSEPGPLDRAVELHGSLFRDRCTACARRRESRERIDAGSDATLPRCEACGGLLRPDVVWFGEPLDPTTLGEAVVAAEAAEVCLVVGTSAVVHPAASIALLAHDRGTPIVEVNPDPTPLTPLAAASIRSRAAEAVPAILDSPGEGFG